MRLRTTPLGFLPGDIALYSHCIFTYTKKDRAYVQNVVDFLSAGLNVGEMCVCAVHGRALGWIKKRMAKLGADAECESGQLCIVDAKGVYMPGGVLDTAAAIRFWRQKLEEGRGRSAGLRTFGDPASMLADRKTRLKFIEYEAFGNRGPTFPMNVAFCGYEVGAVTRSFLLQAKSVHPFIANGRSVRRNTTFVETPKFLAGFYRFRRVSKRYGVGSRGAREAQEDFEEIAARTPLAIPEIGQVRAALGEVLASVGKRARSARGPESAHVHVTFAPDSDQFVVVVWYHGLHSETTSPKQRRLASLHQSDLPLTNQTMDEVHVEHINGDTVVTTARAYSSDPEGRA